MPQTNVSAAQAAISLFNPLPRELDPFTGVGWGQKAYLSLIVGPTYQSIELKSNAIKAIRKISITRNGEEFIAATPAQLIAIEQEQKIYHEDNRLVIPFADFHMRTKAGVRETELVTLPGEVIYLYIEFGDPLDGINAPTLAARAYTTVAQPARYFNPRLTSETWDHVNAGQITHSYKQRSANRFIRRMFLSCEANDITRVEIYRDDKIQFQANAEDNASDLAKLGKECPDGFFVIDFMQFGYGADGKFPTLANQSLDFKITKSTPGPITVLQQISEVVQTAANS